MLPGTHLAIVSATALPTNIAQHDGGCKRHGCIGQWLNAPVHIVKTGHGGGCCGGRLQVPRLRCQGCCSSQVMLCQEAQCPAGEHAKGAVRKPSARGLVASGPARPGTRALAACRT
eukprot:1226817-Alexandrium_andersonii.AAC.1